MDIGQLPIAGGRKSRLVEIGAILFSLAMVLLVADYVLRPLAGSERTAYRDTSRQLSALQAERDRILDFIQEIDMDHTMSKMPEEDYQRQRQALVSEGAEILRSIDELRSKGAPDDSAMELEAAVAQLRGKTSAPSTELKKAAAEMRGMSTTPSPQKAESDSDPGEGVCPECGQAIFHGDRFCSNCGATLEEQVA